MNKIYGYARCSTNEDKQDIQRQIRELKAAGAQEVIEGPVCEMLYYDEYPAIRKGFDKIFEKYGLYYEFGHHWNFSCYYI